LSAGYFRIFSLLTLSAGRLGGPGAARESSPRAPSGPAGCATGIGGDRMRPFAAAARVSRLTPRAFHSCRRPLFRSQPAGEGHSSRTTPEDLAESALLISWIAAVSDPAKETNMAKRLALITGGMGGLGATITSKMVEAGYEVVVTASPRNVNTESWLADMRARGCPVHAVPVDVADYDSCVKCVGRVKDEVGPIDILVNNAGITRDLTFRKMSKADWDAVIHTNLDSVFNMTKQVCDSMTERGWGRIVNVSSVNGQKGAFGQTNYSAAKAGMHGFTKALARELATKGVTVNTISPGYIGTKMVTAIPKEILDTKILPEIPLRRLGLPEEVAGLVIYLCSTEAAFITGANISINGGQHMQ
jgi:acetoacetyl-CoA reductase